MRYMNFKIEIMRHLILCTVMWLCGLGLAVAQNVPQVIPALQQWKSAKGKLVLPESEKVIVSPDEEEALKESAEILVQDLKETLIFPLKQLGDTRMGFKGKVRNLVCIPLKM